MVRKQEEQRKFTRSPGVDIQVLVEPEEIYDAGRLYARIIIAPGASLEHHTHIDEMESYFVLKGTCKIEDNDNIVYLKEGDVLVTPHDQGHSISNETDEPIEIIALIISCKQGAPGKGVSK